MNRVDFGIRAAVLVAALVILDPTTALGQCSICRDAAAAAPAETGRALNAAIVGLALSPYLVALAAAWVVHPGLRDRVRREIRRLLGGPALHP